MKNSVEVEILGNGYKLRTDGSPEYVNKITEYLNEKIKKIAKGSPVISTTDVSILAALNITDELFKLREDVGRKNDKLVEKTNILIEHINKQLEG